jgi:hypothetical protein
VNSPPGRLPATWLLRPQVKPLPLSVITLDLVGQYERPEEGIVFQKILRVVSQAQAVIRGLPPLRSAPASAQEP